jgi:hypothetical protein
MTERQQTISTNSGPEQVSTAGHAGLDETNVAEMNRTITRKMQEGFISGRFYPETAAEKAFLRDYRQANQ